MTETPDFSPVDTDAAEADVQEQAETVTDVEVELPPGESPEVDEFDAAEQRRAIDLDPDEYR